MTTLTIDLSRTETPEDVRALRCAAIALLWAMPDDEVRFVVRSWALMSEAETLEDLDDLHETISAADPETEAVEPETETVSRETETAKPEAETAEPSYGQFEFNGRTYKPTHRGPATAKNAALKVIAGCSELEELQAFSTDLKNLRQWFDEIGRDELEEEVGRLFKEQYFRLAAMEDEGMDALPQEAAEVEAEEVEAEEVEAGEAEAEEAEAEEQLELFREEPVKEIASNGAAEPEKPQMSLKDLGIAVGDKHGKESVIALLEQYGVTKFKDLKSEHVDEFRTKLEALL